MKVRVHGDTAVVTGKTRTKRISGGKPFDSQFQLTDTLVKDGRALAFTRRPCLKAADETKVSSA